MEKSLSTRNSWYWSLFISGFVAILYFIRLVNLNYIFNLGEITLFKDKVDAFIGLPLSVSLPFVFSRMWDIVFIFFAIFLIIKTFYYIKDLQNWNSYFAGAIVYCLLIGLAIGALTSFLVITLISFAFGILISVCLGFFLGLCSGFIFGNYLSFVLCLKSSLRAGLISIPILIISFGSLYGIVLSLILGFSVSLGSIIGLLIVRIIRHI